MGRKKEFFIKLLAWISQTIAGLRHRVDRIRSTAAAIYRCGADKGIALLFAPDRLIGRLLMNTSHPIPDQRGNTSCCPDREGGRIMICAHSRAAHPG